MNAKEQLLEKFYDGSFARLTDVEICKELGIKNGQEKLRIRRLLHELCGEGKLYRDFFFHYGTAEQLGAIKGRISGNEKGFGFLIPEDKSIGHDFFIPKRFMHGAYHKDLVYCMPVKDAKSDDEVEVIAVLERGLREVVGTFYRERNFCFLRPDEKKFCTDVFIPVKASKNCVSGAKAVARITEYPRDKAPGGEIVEILEAENQFFLEELSLIRSHSLKEEFPEPVIRAAEKQAKRPVAGEALLHRKDFREKLIITIDGEDTRDIDDAISVEKDGKYYVLGVYIADVSEYVPYKSELDDEAFERGTSVYFPDRVLPMLPQALSNGICSLNEGEDRLTLSCIMKIDRQGKVIDSEICKSVIRSAHRMTYTDVTAIAEGDRKTIERYPDLPEMIADAVALTRILIDMRAKKGCVDLEINEKKILLGKDGRIEIPDDKRTISHEMIEQFMVLANETVATYMSNLSAPFVYRVHEKPSADKAEEFKNFLSELGVRSRINPEDVRSYDYKNILDRIKDRPIYSVVNRVMLRSMMKAKYSPVNAGHFSLASACYCHFTSPIRRYPDLCIHRIIKEILDGNYEKACEKYKDFVNEASVQSSNTERRAMEAERDVDDLYAVAYMHERIGEEYDAVLSGVTSFGLFAELPNAIEGFIPLETLPEDEYEYIEQKYMLRGRNFSFRIGEEIRVRVVSCHFDTRRTEFQWIEKRKQSASSND